MQFTYATEPSPGRENEDYLATGPNWVLLLDGATAPPGVDSGCIHDVPWLVRHLGGELAHGLAVQLETAPTDLLASAIRATCAAHADTCDLSNSASPSATVAGIRWRSKAVEYFALGDSSLVLDLGHEIRHVTDDRTDHLTDYSVAGIQAARNVPATPQRPSFWVASTVPAAAYEAVTGTMPATAVHRVAALSDGAARWVDRFALGKWSELLDLLTEHGPAELIHQVRVAERAEIEKERTNQRRRGKQHDDATAALATCS